MPANVEFNEVARFFVGLLGLLLTIGCLRATIRDYRMLHRDQTTTEHERDLRCERLIVAAGWVRAALARTLTCTMLMLSGLLLMAIPKGPASHTFERQAISWGWLILAVVMVVQAWLAHRDRQRIRRLRP